MLNLHLRSLLLIWGDNYQNQYLKKATFVGAGVNQNHERSYMKSLIATLAFVTLLTGCATAPPPPLNYAVPEVGVSRVKHDAELKSITVSIANQSEATGRLHPNMGRTPELWKNSLQEGVNSMIIFKDDAPKKVNLAVKILKFDPPANGFDLTTKTEARYEIVDRSNGDIIYSQNIATSGTVEFQENSLAVARIIESANRAVRNNIGQFLQGLESIDFKKPMFPANK